MRSQKDEEEGKRKKLEKQLANLFNPRKPAPREEKKAKPQQSEFKGWLQICEETLPQESYEAIVKTR